LNLAAAKRRVEVLPRQLDGELDEFDHVLIGCPPNQGLLAVSAVVLAKRAACAGAGDQPGFDQRPR